MGCIAAQQEQPLAGVTPDERRDEMAAHSRSLRNNIISLAVFFVLVAALLSAVPGLRSAIDHISDANVGWLALAILFEILSCVGYVVLFDLVFGELGARLTTRLALAELAVNSVVSAGGLGGIALGAWVLRTRGVSGESIARRSVLIFVLTSAANVAAVVLIGMAMWLGLLPGSRDALLTLLPAALALSAIVGVLVIASLAGELASRERFSRGRVGIALEALCAGVSQALAAIRRGDSRLLGALAYWLFDNLVLYACLAAFAHAPSVWVVGMAYLVGMLANSLPVPGGLVAVEGGLFGMLILFGARPATLVLAAVVLYRVISLWVPALIGSLSFLSLRREIGKPLEPARAG
jgi:uncharacterized membrane protein YbhN (UPF0104 family)